MPTPPYNTNTVLAWLDGAFSFIARYTRNSTPFIFNSSGNNRNSFHDVEGRLGYLPITSGTSEGATIASLACGRAFRATNNISWGNKCVELCNSLLSIYYPNPNPPTILNANTLWISHWASSAGNKNVIPKGSQSAAKPFNFGYFDVIVSFVNGVGTLPGGTIADLYKVYSTDGALLFQNVFSPLKSGTEYTINYWVSNYQLEGKLFRTTQGGVRTLTTGESAGKIVLGGAYANYTGDAKVVYSNWEGNPILPNQLVEAYPLWHNPIRAGNDFYLGAAIDALWWMSDCSQEAYAITGNIYYANCYNANKQTVINAAIVENPSFFYKREPGLPFILAGAQVVPVNRPSNGYTASRVNSPGSFQYYLRLDLQAATPANYPSAELQNYIIQVSLSSTISVYVEAATNVTQILEIVFSLSQNTLDTSQEYRAYWLITGNSTPQTITIGFNSFIKWGTGTIWHSLIADDPLYKILGVGTVVITQEQATIDGRLAIAQVATVKPNGGFSGVGLVLATFTNQPPSIKFATTYSNSKSGWLMKLRDSDGDYWVSSLPNTNGAWQTYSPSWSSFQNLAGKPAPATGTILECNFEAFDDAVIKLYYAGAAPQVPPQGSTSYKTLLRSRVASAQTLWIGNFYPIGNTNDKLKYNPGVVPFTINVLSDGLGGFVKDSWGGAPYAGYQSPYHWQVWGYPDRANQALQFLNDSQLAYQKQSSSGLLAPLMQVFLWKYWDTADFRTYGSEGDEWSWKGADPNTAWFPYCARPMESTARYLMLVPNSNVARRILTRYLTWIQSFLISTGGQPPTDVPPVINPQANYHEPHAAALILRTALYVNVAGLLPEVTLDIIQRCYNYLTTQYISSGVMAGSFTAGQPTFVSNGVTYREYFAFWHMEIVSTLAELINYKDKLKYPYQDLIAQAGVYPSLVPSSIDEIKLPPFKANRVKFDDGSTQRTLLSQSGVKTEISLKYEFLTAEEAKVLIDFWRVSQGTRIPFTLPSNILRSPAVIISGITAQGSTTYWRFAEGFDLETEFATSTRGIYGASVRIVSVVN